MSLRPIVTRLTALLPPDRRAGTLGPVPATRRRGRRTFSAGVVAVLAVGIAACGGDDESGGGARLDDETFCERFRQLELEAAATPSDDVDDRILEGLAALAPQAPTDELGDALEVFARVGAELAAIDENDPEAFDEALATAFDPEFVAAGETLESFTVGTCGFEPTDSGMDFSGSGSGDGGQIGSAFDDLDAGALNDEMGPAIEQFAPDSQGSGITIFPAGDGTTVEVQVFTPSSLDAVALCEALAAAVGAGTTDPTVTVEVSDDGVVVASRPPGGACAAT